MGASFPFPPGEAGVTFHSLGSLTDLPPVLFLTGAVFYSSLLKPGLHQFSLNLCPQAGPPFRGFRVGFLSCPERPLQDSSSPHASRESRPQINSHRLPHLTSSFAIFNTLGSPQLHYWGGGGLCRQWPPESCRVRSSPPRFLPAFPQQGSPALSTSHLFAVSVTSLSLFPAPSPPILHRLF